MKTMMTFSTVITALALGLACATPTFGDDRGVEPKATTQEAQKEKAFKGTVSAVDAKERTLTVKSFGFKRTFNVAENCAVALADRPQASLAELRPGQNVEVNYQKEQGVLIARRIAQENVTYKGHVTAIDPAGRTLSIKHAGITRDFTISENCPVLLNNYRTGTMDDLKVGQTVNVVYERNNGSLTARKIEQKYETFAGTIRAIDTGAKTVKAKHLMTERKFNLASGCKIVVEGKPDARLSDLRIGDRVELSYEDADGVLVANRIGRDANLPETERSQSAQYSPVMP